MGERVKQIGGKVKEFFSKMSKRVIVLLILLAVAIVALIGGLMFIFIHVKVAVGNEDYDHEG